MIEEASEKLMTPDMIERKEMNEKNALLGIPGFLWQTICDLDDELIADSTPRDFQLEKKS